MKNILKKVLYTSTGILFGSLFFNYVSAANVGDDMPGNPQIFNGVSGSRFSGGNSGRFGSIQQLGQFLIQQIEILLVPLIISLALISFLWGVLKFIKDGNDPSAREQGRQFMIWGVIGLAVMVSVWGLVRILTNTIGVPLGVPGATPR